MKKQKTNSPTLPPLTSLEPTNEERALDILIEHLIHSGRVVFDAYGVGGPTLLIKSGPQTVDYLTDIETDILISAGVPPISAPTFDDLLSATTDDARLFMEEVRDADEEDNFMEVFRQLAPLINKDRGKRR